jgi:hypothetical protein
MKFFSRQLLVKHMFMRQCEGEGCREAERQIDALIEPNHFLNIADLQPRSMQLLKEEQLSLDDLFSLSSADLHDLVVRLGLPLEEEEKLGSYLNLLATYYSESLHHCCDNVAMAT